MIKSFFLCFLIFCSALFSAQKNMLIDQEINQLLDAWHLAAAKANYANYFDALSNDAVFIGTDASEVWNKKEFEAYSKPYFDKGKAWNFTALKRNIYFDKDTNVVWFDELLDTQMKLCRGSGILKKENNHWKIRHYVLSMAIPNDVTKEVVKAKSIIEQNIINQIKNSK